MDIWQADCNRVEPWGNPGAVLDGAGWGSKVGATMVLPPAASWAEEADVDAATAHCLLEG